METKDWNITQVVDVTNCREKAVMYRGLATAVVDKISKEVSLVFFLSIDAADSAIINQTD